MDKNEISIIIPCYNSGKYINNCLDSIKKQIEFFKYEIILIDDKSTDDTINIIKKRIEKKDLIIKLIENKVNLGAGASRNIAVKESKYDYISFIDADDYVDNNYYEEMFKSLNESKVDVVVCDINIIYDNITNKIKLGCDGETNKLNIINTPLCSSPCNKIIKKELLIKYPFPEGIINEDIATIIPILGSAKKIEYNKLTKYNYIQHNESVQNSKLSIKRFDLFKSFDLLDKRIKELKEYDNIKEITIYQQIVQFIMHVIQNEKNIFKQYKYLKLLKKQMNNYMFLENEYLNDYIIKSNNNVKKYYKSLFKFIDKNNIFFACLQMNLLRFYKSIKHNKIRVCFKSVIKKNITIDTLINIAKIQSELKDELVGVSVVIPNYNYSSFLYERLYSILNQSYKINEIIILDDKSTDDSRFIIDELCDKLSNYIDIKKEYNDKNTGSAFIQWEKGLKLAKNDYVWIAEADDYCNKNMIKNLIKPIINDKEIVISYCDTCFIDKNGLKLNKTIKHDIDIMKTNHWNNDYIIDGKEEIEKYSYLNCTIANVSSAIIKKDNYETIFSNSKKYKQVGDWRFYLGLYEKGKISYINKTYNYYRVHGNNITSTTNRIKHLNEIYQIHEELRKKYNFTKNQEKMIEMRYNNLKKVWNIK